MSDSSPEHTFKIHHKYTDVRFIISTQMLNSSPEHRCQIHHHNTDVKFITRTEMSDSSPVHRSEIHHQKIWAGMESKPGDLPLESSRTAFWISSKVGRASMVSSTRTWGSLSMASSLMVEILFRTLSKCSAHLSKTFSLSVIRVNPSALRRGDSDPEVVGP